MLKLTKHSANGLALLLKEVFVSGPMLKCKAEEFVKKMGYKHENFKATKGSFFRWKKRHDIKSLWEKSEC